MDNYSQATADIDTPLGQAKGNSVSNGFLSIDDVSINEIAMQNQISPRHVRTGTTRGDQQVKGTYQVADSNNVIRVVMGFIQNGF